MVYSAVLRELLVVGEAIKQLPAEMRDDAPDVPWRAWAGLRDIVVHQYFGLQDATIWQIVTEEIPAVSSAISAIIRSLPEAD